MNTPFLAVQRATIAFLCALLIACGPNGGPSDSQVNNPGPPAADSNRAPVAVTDIHVLPLPVAISIEPLANDTDPDGDALSLVSVDPPGTGSAVVNGTKIVYTPGIDFVMRDEFSYSIGDGRGGRASGNIVIEVADTPGNSAPIAVQDKISVGMDGAIHVTVLNNDFDPDGDQPVLMGAGQPLNGNVTLDDGGTPADPTDDRLLYQPTAGFTGPDSFTYRISDGIEESQATVNVVVGGVEGELISGIVSKGPVTGAVIELYAADAMGNATGPVLANTNTDASGYWSTGVINRSGPLIARVVGGRYLDEVVAGAGNLDAAVVTIDSPGALAAALPINEDFVAITPYSHAVLLRARWLTEPGAFAESHADARDIIGNALGFDPLGVAPGNPLLPQTGADAPSAYAMALGGLAYSLRALSLATGVAAPVDDLLRAVAEDLTDCLLDGTGVAGPVNVALAGVTIALPVATNLNSEILRFRNNNFTNLSGTPIVAVDASGCVLAELPPPSFSALPSALTIDAESAAGTPITSPQVVTFLAGAVANDANGNTLVVNNDAPAVIAPGTQPVTFTATDSGGNSTSVTVDLTVADLSAPEIADPEFVIAAQTGLLTPVALTPPVVSDNVSNPVDIVLSNDAPVAFPPGTTVVTWTAQDEAGLIATVPQTVSVVAPGGPGVIAPLDDASGVEGTPVAIATAGAFSAGTYSYSVVGLPAGSGLAIDAVTGTVSGTPGNADALASPMVLNVVATSMGVVLAVPLNLTVTNLNDAPVVVLPPTPVAALEGDSFTIDLRDVFSDPDLDALVFAATGLPPGLALGGDGTLTGMFDQADATGSPYSVLLRASDGLLDATVTLSISVADVNGAPVIVTPPPNRNLTEDLPAAFDVSGSFTDPEGDALTFSYTGLPASMTGSAAGTVSGTPGNDDVSGSPYGVTVTATDPAGASIAASFLLAVQNVNDAPRLLAPIGAQTAVQDLPFLLDTGARFFDDDGDVLIFTATGLPASLSIDANGVIAGTTSAADLGASPYTVTIAASDTSGAGTADTFELTLVSSNSPPLISTIANPAPLNEDDTLSLPFTVSDTETAAASLSITVSASNPVLLPAPALVITGSGESRTLALTPAADRSGSSSVTISVSDGTASAETTFVLDVQPVNDAPVFALSGDVTETEDFTGVRSVTVTAGAVPTDEAAHSVMYSVTPATVGFADISIDPVTGTVSISAVADATGVQLVTVTADDGQGANNLATATFMLTISAVNDVPVITGQTGPLATLKDTGIELTLADLAVTDSDNAYPADFTLAVQPGANYLVAGNTVTPVGGYSGSLNVPVTVNDGTGDSASFIMAIDVIDVNTAPVITAQAGPLVTPEETGIVLGFANLSVTDPDNTYPADFTISVLAGANYSFNGTTVTPASDFVGTLTVPVTVNDGTDDSASFMVTIDVTPVNDAPVITALTGALSTPEETDIVIALTDLAVTDPDNSYPADFTLTVLPGANYVFTGTTVTPDTDFFGTFNVPVTVSDGTEDSASFMVNINVTPVNDAPVITAQAGPLATPEETGIVLALADLAVTDIDNTYPTDFTLTVQAGANYSFTGTTVTPSTDFVGTLNVPVTVNDGADDSAIFVVSIDVTPVNDAPVITAQAGPLATPEEAGIVLALADLAVTDIDNTYPTDFTLTVQAGANYSFTGTTVTPASDFIGTLNVPVTVNDGTDDSTPFVVSIDVTNINDAPVITAQAGPLSTPEETDIALALTDLAVTDPDNSYPADFALTVLPGANYVFTGTTVTPDTDFDGSLNVPVTVSDGTDDSVSFVVTIDVTPVNDAPVITAQAGPLATPEETGLGLTLTDLTVTDIDNTYPTGFTLTVQAGANYSFTGTMITPAADYVGTLNVPVTVNDGTDDSAPFVVTIDVTPVNDAPVITAQTGPLTTPEETDIVLTLTDLAVTDPDNSYPADFTLAVQAGADYSFAGTTVTPASDFDGTLNVSVTVNDGTDDSAPFVVSISVTNINDAPVITAQTGPLATPEETGIVLALTDLAVTDPDNSYPADFTLTVQAGADYSFTGTTVTPDTDFVGTLNVPVTVSDGTDDSASFVVTIDVTPVNDAPVITAQTGPLSTPEETDIVLALADLTVTDVDNAYPADFTLAVQAGAGYTFAGTTVTPNTDFVGTFSVSVTVNDGTDDSDSFVVSIDVTPVNDVPVITAQAGPLSTPEETDIVLVPGDLVVSDPDNSYPADFTLIVRPGARYSVAGDTVTPEPEFNGTLAVPVAVDDGTDTSIDFIVNITVDPVNDQPSISAHERLVGLQDNVFTLVPDHLTVIDFDHAFPVGFTIDALPGTSYTASGADITPDAGFTGTLNVPVTVTDPSGAANATSAPFVVNIDIEAGLADLSLELGVDKTRPAVGENITLSVTVINDGPDIATGVSVRSIVYAGYKYISDDSGGALSGPVWTVGTLNVGEQKILNVILEIENAGPYVLATEIDASDQVDPDSIPGNFVAGEDDIDSVETPPPGIPQDEDGDGIRDGLELLLGTDQKKEDTDADWISDYVELLAGDDPLTPSATTRIVHVDPGVDTPGTGDDWDTAYATLTDALLDPRVATGGALDQPVYIRIAESAVPTSGANWALQLDGACDHMVFIGSQDPGNENVTLPLLTDAAEPTTILDAAGAAHAVIDGCENVWLHGLEFTGGDRGVGAGGALRAQNGTRLGLREVRVRGNTAAHGGGLLATGAGTELTALDSVVERNVASQSGGGITVTAAAVMQLTDTSIVRNSSSVSGGGVFVDGGTLETDDVTIADNFTSGDGGGLYLQTDALNGPGSLIDHSVISNNVAQGSGGGIAIGTSGVYAGVFNTLVVGNIAARGAAASFDDNSGSMSNVTAVDNRTTLVTTGAAIYVQNATPVISDSVFARNIDAALAAGTFEVSSGSVSSSYNLLEQPPVGVGDIDITISGPVFTSAYYFDQATSPGVNSGSMTSEMVGLESFFTDDAGTTSDVGVLDRGYHYPDGYPAGNPDYAEATPLPGDKTDEVILTMTPATDTNQLVVVRVDADNDPFPTGHRIVATLEDGTIAQLHTPIGLDPLNDGESVLLIDLGDGDYGFYVDGQALGETDMRLYVDGQLLGKKVKIKYLTVP